MTLVMTRLEVLVIGLVMCCCRIVWMEVVSVQYDYTFLYWVKLAYYRMMGGSNRGNG
jgi:hypothetical protein